MNNVTGAVFPVIVTVSTVSPDYVIHVNYCY